LKSPGKKEGTELKKEGKSTNPSDRKLSGRRGHLSFGHDAGEREGVGMGREGSSTGRKGGKKEKFTQDGEGRIKKNGLSTEGGGRRRKIWRLRKKDRRKNGFKGRHGHC